MPQLNIVRQGQGPLVVLSHALGCDLTMWDGVAAALQDRYTVLRYDQRGHGQTPATEGAYSMDDLADDAAELIRAQADRCRDILRSMGRKMPEEVGVAGFDNYRAIAETLYPPLTTVELPYNAMGARAGERLLALISGEGRNDAAPVLVAGPVHWRASVHEVRKPNLVTFKTLREEIK